MTQIFEQDKEIDLSELFAAVICQWWILISISVVGLSVSGYYAYMVATPEYEASSRFELLSGSQSGGSFAGAAEIAAIAGFSVPSTTSEADALIDRVLSRPFVKSIYESAGFRTDPEFNSLLQSPSIVAQISQWLFGKTEDQERSEDFFHVMAIEGLANRITVSPGENGIIRLSVSHPDGERAAQIANLVVEQSLEDIFLREQNETRGALNYFASELLQVRSDLDDASSALRDYALSNSLQSPEELARTSSQLSLIRADIEAIDDSMLALQAMSEDDFLAIEFAREFPISSSLSFRRLLNLSSNPLEWEKPTAEDVELSFARLKEQRVSLLSSFETLEARARRFGREALELAKLQREVEVQQAVYESVITQFEARSLWSGYEQASGRIVETAIAPLAPTSPRKVLLLALGLMLGLILGTVIAIVRSVARGTLYKAATLREAVGYTEVIVRRKSELNSLHTWSRAERDPKLFRDVLSAIPFDAQVVGIFATSSSPLSERLSQGLARISNASEKKVAFLNLSEASEGKQEGCENLDDVLQSVRKKVVGGIDHFYPDDLGAVFSNKNLENIVDKLRQKYAKTFVLLDAPSKGIALSRKMTPLVDAAIVVAERGKTTRSNLTEAKSIIAKSNVSDPLLTIF